MGKDVDWNHIRPMIELSLPALPASSSADFIPSSVPLPGRVDRFSPSRFAVSKELKLMPAGLEAQWR